MKEIEIQVYSLRRFQRNNQTTECDFQFRHEISFFLSACISSTSLIFLYTSENYNKLLAGCSKAFSACFSFSSFLKNLHGKTVNNGRVSKFIR